YYNILYNPTAQIIFLTVILLFLAYLILYIPFLLGLLKSISQAYNGEKPDYKSNLKYGFSNLGNSFKTYWYIFAYVALIPALLFIIGGISVGYGMKYETEIFTNIGGIIVGISLIIFLVFSIYRGTKAAFGLQSAVDSNNYSLENFKQSVKITKEKFWRILGNFMLVGFIGGLVVGMIMGVVDNFGSSFGMGANTFFEKIQGDGIDAEIAFQAILNELISSYSPIANIITNTIQGVIKTTFSIFLIVFTYMFFKRLEIESNESVSTLQGSPDEL
ncbi:glycerophosphoryl diester phosphodiesterase membrane domain-containing protein, partial [Candidatus Gracilibacteria bacterium]|nr:glycerophosphoryl diester phosphodiesterase membrane domain-containing protein [Candidatus Gracilibacteria bacterium]